MELFAFDDDYVRRLREGDRETEAHFHSYFHDLLAMKLRRRLPSPQAVDDVRQEVFTRVLAKVGELRDGRKLGAFVNSICNHVLMETYREGRRSERLGEEANEEAAPDDIEGTYLSEETAARVRRVLSRLPERDQKILRAIFLDDGDKEEVCARFGVDRSYLRVLLHRAKEKFRLEFARKSTPNLIETLGRRSSLPL
jgi:RNA polymerase sigma-70 factor (ECF subfamily)